MKLTELLTSPWAILPDSLREIQQIYATHLKGDKIDIPSLEARLGRPLANEQQRYQVREGGVAVLPIEGVIAPKANLFTEISGGASAQMLTQQVLSAAADSRVKGLVLSIDSPGGSVFGTPELAAAISQVSREKPVVSVSDATMASAAYWIGSAANAVYITGPTVNVGSIGVYTRLGVSQADPTATEFVRGKYKRSAINGQAPSAEYMAYFEARLDHLYSVFVDTVAAQRGVSSEQALEHMADAREFIGQQAIDAGLADGFATVDAIVERMATNPAQYANRRKAVFALGGLSAEPAGVLAGGTPQPTEPVLLGAPDPTQGKPTMTITREQIAAEAPELLQALMAEGASAERERIQAVEAQLIPGHEALIASLKFDGKSGPGEAAMAINAAERNLRTAAAQAAAAEAPKPVAIVPGATITAVLPSAAEQAAAAAAGAGVDASLPLEDRCKAAWDKDANLRKEFSSVGAFTAFTKATEEGRARIFARG
ncbi:S49 family peptidase [Hydrogenophaga taeniospiralis]|uniref:S49 family peptidase n=1 Tax=Hydrogenophaga taeniospiralis TaxID=65656 RepID=UPI001CFA8F5E|nr:S49 family peptidase [Hydrogenophaga taeniospiralis]MCB4365410.1 S49 family peptidase [Hydrogenophaga taeniospiralis]